MDSDSVLDGLKVIDLSHTLPGTQTSQIFADFGAEVVHVEPPGGSPLRAQGSYPFWGRGKKSLVADLKSQQDLAVVTALVQQADIVIETFRPGVAERLGLGYEALSSTNPRLVYGSITGFGRTGPLAGMKGYEGIVFAKLGGPTVLADMSDRPGPSFASSPYCSYPATQLLAQGLLAALMERDRSGVGQRVETSLAQGLTIHDTFGWFARVLALRFGQAFAQAPLVSNGVPAGGLSFRLLIALTKDGRWLQFSQTAERLFRAMMKAFELEWMFDDPKFKTAPDFDDVDVRVEFWERMLGVVRSKTVAEWQVVFEEHPDVWGEIFRHGAEVLDHPQMVWNGQVATVEDPRFGTVRQPGPIAEFSGTPAVLRPAPGLDEHGAELRGRANAPAAATTTRGTAVPAGPATAGPATAGDTRPPLDGILALELGTYYAAPFGATLLAEYGARVIKVEQLDGDPMRNMLPFPEIAGIKALQGKESLGVDVSTEKGRAIVYELVKRADIVLQSFRAGVAERQGLDAETLQKINPNLVYVSSPGYGTGGPYGRRPAFAPTIGAGAGNASRNAGATIPEGPDLPLDVVKQSAMRMALAVMGVGNSDGFSAATVGTALMLGLVARHRGAGAQRLCTSMLASTAHALSDVTVEYANRAAAPTADIGLHGFSPLYRLYETAAGWVFLAAPSERDWPVLAKALGLPSQLDRNDDDAVASAIGSALSARSAADWERDLLAADIACVEVAQGPVESNFIDEGSVGRLHGFVTDTTHPTLDAHPRLGPYVRLSRSTGVAAGGCLVGQHTDAIMRELGHSEESIGALRLEGVLGG